MQDLGARLQLDQAGHGLAVTPRTGQQRHRHRVHPPVGAERQQRVDGPALKRAVQLVAGFKGKTAGLMPLPPPGADPALAAHHHGHRLVQYLDLQHGFFLCLDQGASRVGKLLGVRFNFLDEQAPQRRRVAEDFFQPKLLVLERFQLLLNFDGFKPGQLAQADFQNVLGLSVAQLEPLDQRRLRLVRLPDDGDHLVDVEQHQLPPFQNMDAVQHLVQPMT